MYSHRTVFFFLQFIHESDIYIYHIHPTMSCKNIYHIQPTMRSTKEEDEEDEDEDCGGDP